ncbi:MAG TPA: GNAT family protein, partial [Pseudonocardiaceae bacterium]|nr:GNAT family protein [Pseudonocardiaceae bacterium]
WRPLSPGTAASRYAIRPPSEDQACFSVVDLATRDLTGEAVLWGIDTHNRTAHIGMSLRPRYRGKGLAADVVRVLCHYGFVVLGLHRLQVDTLADNAAMIGAARRAGFTMEGTLRDGAWVTGVFADEVVLGMLAGEWASERRAVD